MVYGMNLLLWTTRVDESHLPVLESLAGMGYGLVEVPVFDIEDPAAYAKLGRRIRDMGMQPSAVSALNADQNIASSDKKVRARGEADMMRMLDCAAALGAPFLSGPMHSAIGVFSGLGPTTDDIHRSAECLSRVAAYGATQGVRLGIEPLNRFECYLMNDLASAATYAAMVGSGARVLYDTFHAHIEEKDVAAAIRTHGASIGLVHISENDRSTPGRGQVRWSETFGALRDVGYGGPLIVEAFGLALPELSAATRIWRRMFSDELALARDALVFMRENWEFQPSYGVSAVS
jgi:D-psicose/D-tagatose/L-ribulose 3-epimerase